MQADELTLTCSFQAQTRLKGEIGWLVIHDWFDPSSSHYTRRYGVYTVTATQMVSHAARFAPGGVAGVWQQIVMQHVCYIQESEVVFVGLWLVAYG